MRNITTVVAVLVAAASATSTVQAQSHTTFVPGLGAHPFWWTRQNTIGRLQTQVVLPDPRTPFISTTLSVQTQANQLRSSMAQVSGQHVLIGHSMGGMVIRRAFFDDAGPVFGMLSVGTPHSGALVADNASVFQSYVASVISAVNSPASELAGIAGSRARQLVSGALNNLSSMIANQMPLNTAGALDARTTSSASSFNRTSLDNIPHGNVYGTIDKRRAWMRVAHGAIDGTNNSVSDWSLIMNLSMGVFRACQSTRRWIITYWSLARRCGRAYNAMNTFDDGWHRYTANGAPFDGWIANSASAYPGTSLSDANVNRQVPGVDHNSLISDQRGINAMALQLRSRLGLQQP